MSGAPPLFLDRDGTLIEEVHYLSRLEDVRLVPGAAQAVRAANAAGHSVIVATNQSGVARGYIDEAFVHASMELLARLLAEHGARLDAWYYCPHLPDGQPPYDRACACRKPAPGMLHRAAAEHGLTLAGGWMVGDRRSDLEVGLAAGLTPVLVRTGYGAETEANLPPAFAAQGGRVFDALPDAVRWMLGDGGQRAPAR